MAAVGVSTVVVLMAAVGVSTVVVLMAAVVVSTVVAPIGAGVFVALATGEAVDWVPPQAASTGRMSTSTDRANQRTRRGIQTPVLA